MAIILVTFDLKQRVAAIAGMDHPPDVAALIQATLLIPTGCEPKENSRCHHAAVNYLIRLMPAASIW